MFFFTMIDKLYKRRTVVGLTLLLFFTGLFGQVIMAATTTNSINVSANILPTGPYCGDGVVNQPSEECDDGNNVSGDGCDSNCKVEVTSPPIVAGGKQIKYSAIYFQGYTSPSAFVTLTKEGVVTATTIADIKGEFSFLLEGIPEGVYNFSLKAEDRFLRLNLPINFSITAATSTTQLTDILLPPTISIVRQRVFQNSDIFISGETEPQAKVEVLFFPGNKIFTASADGKGFWQLDISADKFEIGEYSLKAKSKNRQGIESAFSQTLGLVISPAPVVSGCRGPDLNNDGRVNIFDLSILLAHWLKQSEERICEDINFDHHIDIVDFSIMLYFWTD